MPMAKLNTVSMSMVVMMMTSWVLLICATLDMDPVVTTVTLMVMAMSSTTPALLTARRFVVCGAFTEEETGGNSLWRQLPARKLQKVGWRRKKVNIGRFLEIARWR